MVGDLYTAGRHSDIAEYCLRDVSSTWDLFEAWERVLRF
jgi:hypothetical protein